MIFLSIPKAFQEHLWLFSHQFEVDSTICLNFRILLKFYRCVPVVASL